MLTYKVTYKNGETVREHRYIAEQMVGRKLTFNEVVHHIDGNKRNNSPENLQIMTRAEHAKIHSKELDKSKPVIQLDRDDNIICIWNSAKKAANSLSLYAGNISKCCHGALKTTGGYKWKFAE